MTAIYRQALLVASLLLICAPAAGARWPARPVTIVVPAGVGGGTDHTARMLARRLEARLGVPFNIVNRGQGSGVIGFDSIKRAAPDGYTLGVIYNFAHYRPMGQGDFSVGDFSPIAQFNFDPAAFLVRQDSSYNTLGEALAALKANPGRYTIACAGGCGGSWSMALARLLDAYGIELSTIRMVPGRGAASALQDLVAGGLDVVPSSLPEASPLIAAGHVKPLAVFSDTRLAVFPDVPTVEEAVGFSIRLGAWRGLVGPAGLPVEISNQLEEAVAAIVSSPDWRKEMSARGFGIQWSSSRDFSAFLQSQEMMVRSMLSKLRAR